jgi:hypothetical protein
MNVITFGEIIMSEEIIINSEVEETVEQYNSIKYCPICEQPQHCGHAVTYALTDDDGNIIPEAFAECSMCECMDCTGET